MCNDMCASSVTICLPDGSTKQLMTLEQLYLKCVLSEKKISSHQSAVTLITDLDVALRKDCFDHLQKLMPDTTIEGIDNKEKKRFADECITKKKSPFDVRKDANELKGGRCYWPDCP